MPGLAVAFLGLPEISIDGHLVQTDRRKAVALLAYLAVTGQPHSREALAALLWPDYERDSAHAYLRRTVWELNQLLGKGWMAANRDSIQFTGGAGARLDVVEFEALLVRARTGADPALLEAAIALYRGDFMSGFVVAEAAPFEEWQGQQAEHYRHQLARALEIIVAARVNLKDPQTALPYARRWLALDSFNEAAHRALMRLLAGLGDRAGVIRQYQTCVQSLKTELGIPPQPETTALYEALLRGDLAAAAPAQTPPPHADTARSENPGAPRLPVMLTPFIGRRPEVDEVKDLLQDPARRLITLIGPGGIGKTRLALQAASELSEAFPDGVFFAALASVPTAEAVIPALAKALEFSFNGDEPPRQQLLDFLRGKYQLLILDNCEHLLEASVLVAEILGQAPRVKLLATSRARLNVPGEQLYPVAGLHLPDPAEAGAWDDPERQARSFSAVQLFLERARRVRPGFTLTKATVASVLEICRLVQGMPLGVELAAAWLELLPPAEIAASLARSLDFLTTEQPGVPERQRSLRAVFESSWTLLSDAEREAFERLCVCVGSFSREAAQQVSGATLKALLGLANKSWLQQTTDGRFQLHEVLRQYGQARLRARDEAWRAANDRHAAYFARFVADQSARMRGPAQLDGLRALDEEFATNVRAAWTWLAAEQRWGDLVEQMAPGLFQHGTIRQQLRELLPWLRAARLGLDSASDGRERLAFAIVSTLEVHCEESEQIKDDNPTERLEAVWRCVRQYDLAEPMGFWFVLLAGMAQARNLDPEAGKRLDEAVARLRRHADAWGLGMSLLIQSNWWSGVGIDVGPLPEAAHLFQTLGVIYEQGLAAELLVRHGLEQKRPSADVAGVLRQAEAFYRRLDAHLHLIRVFSFWSALHFLNGEYEQGWAIYHEIQREFERQGNVRQLATSLHWESLAAARNSTFEHALATRQRSLELVREREAPSVLAWRLFELGDLYRIFDQPAQALSYYDQARASFEQMNVLLGLGFDHRARGDLALAEARSAEALAHYRQFLACALRDNHRWSIAQARGKLALALAHGGDADASRSELREAFRAARAWWEPGLILLILLAEPVCCLHEGRPEQAVELAGLLIHHPHTWNETKQQARAILATATHALPAEIVQAALERGQQLELEAVVQQLLGE